MDAATKGKSSQQGRARQFLIEVTGDGIQKNQFDCTLCSTRLNGNCKSNLVAHFKSCHKDIYYSKIANPQEDHISIRRLQTVYSCVELLTINSQPFSVLSSSGFRYAIQHEIRAYQLAGCSLNLSDQHVYEIKDKVIEVAMKIKELIQLEVKDKIISVMVDGATRNTRSLFGINIQYKVNGVLKVVTLGVRQLNLSHTAEYLGNVLQEVLSEYGIKLSQVISITTDNGSNMLAMVKDLENKLFVDSEPELQDQDNNQDKNQTNDQNINFAVQERDGTNTQNVSEAQTEDEIDQILRSEEKTDDDALDILFDDSSVYADLLDKLVADMRARSGNHHLFMASIKCAAHTLQLAVNDAIKILGKRDSNFIALCRMVAKFLRLQSTRNQIYHHNLQAIVPKLDVETRWSSTYLMIRDVAKCRTVIEHFAEVEKTCELLLRKWNVLEEIKRVLHIPYLTTVLLQKNDFTLSDFYGCIQVIELKLTQIIQNSARMNTKLAHSLLKCINDRKPKLIDTPLMLCCLLLDPRYKFCMNNEQIQLAKITLEHIWERIESFGSSCQEKTQNLDTTPDDMASFYEELDLHLTQSLGIRNSSIGTSGKFSLGNAISKYESSVDGRRMKSGDSIHEFWDSNKEVFGSQLYQVACIVFSIPPTQASVERDFSALKYMFTDKRYALKPNLLEALLVIHLNRDFFMKVRDEEIENERKKFN